jgi:hypothetical protein
MTGSGNARFAMAAFGVKNHTMYAVFNAQIYGGESNRFPNAFSGDNGQMIGGNNNTISGGSRAQIVGGTSNTKSGGAGPGIYASSNTSFTQGASFAVVVGSRQSTMAGGDTVGIIGGQNNRIDYGFADFIFGGYQNLITGRNNDGRGSVLVGGNDNEINGNGIRAVAILGGTKHFISGSDIDNSAIIAGSGSIVDHDQKVTIVGTALRSSRDNEVIVPNLSIYGTTYISGSLGTGSLIDNLGQVGVGTTDEVQHIVYCTQADYDGLTPDINTLYVISGSGVSSPVNTLTNAPGTSTMDCSLGNYFTLAMPVGGVIDLVPSNINPGQTITVVVTQNATTPSTLTFDNAIEWGGGTAPTLSPGLSAVDVFEFRSVGSSILYGSTLGQNYS